MKEKIHKKKLYEREKQRKENELEKFLEKKNKPNARLPLPNPEDKLSIYGMPLKKEENPERKNLIKLRGAILEQALRSSFT